MEPSITTLEKVQSATGIKGKEEQITALIPQVEEWIKGYTNQLMPDENGKYPLGYEKIAIEMIVYDLNTIAKHGLKSESLSRHSVTYEGGSGTYPIAVTKGLRRRLMW